MDEIRELFEENLILNHVFLGNLVKEWLFAFLVFLGAILAMKIFKTVILNRVRNFSEKTETKVDDITINGIKSIHWPFFVLVSAYLASKTLVLGETVKLWAYYIMIISVAYYVIQFLQEFVDYGAKMMINKRKDVEQSTGIIKFIAALTKIVLWVIAIMLILSNMGFNVTSLIAGLGIGGIAVALAMQNILGDLFSSLVIYFDKPFQEGDFVVVGQHMGTVKRVGIKTTRIQALQGEEIVISNQELTSSRIQNFGRMEKRRVVFTLGLTYDTPLEKLKLADDIIEKVVTKQNNADIERVHFKSFGPSSLDYEVVYYVHSADYNQYMDIQQSINLSIIEKFRKNGIDFAFPTQTIHLEGGEAQTILKKKKQAAFTA